MHQGEPDGVLGRLGQLAGGGEVALELAARADRGDLAAVQADGGGHGLQEQAGDDEGVDAPAGYQVRGLAGDRASAVGAAPAMLAERDADVAAAANGPGLAVGVAVAVPGDAVVDLGRSVTAMDEAALGVDVVVAGEEDEAVAAQGGAAAPPWADGWTVLPLPGRPGHNDREWSLGSGIASRDQAAAT